MKISFMFAVFLSLPLFGALTLDEEKAMLTTDQRKFVPLWTQGAISPRLAVLLGEELYFAGPPEAEGCAGSNLYRVTAKQEAEKKEEVLAAVPCLLSLQDVDGRLVIEFWEAAPPAPAANYILGPQLAFWNGTEVDRNIAKVLPVFENLKGQLAFLLHSIGDRDYSPKRGKEMRKAEVVRWAFGKVNGQTGIAMRLIGADDAESMPIVGWVLAGKDETPILSSVLDWKGQNKLLQFEMVVGPNGNLFFLKPDKETGNIYLEEIEATTGKRVGGYLPSRDKQVESLQRPSFLVSLAEGVLVADRPTGAGLERKAWYYSIKDQAWQVTLLSTRDLKSVSRAGNGLVLGRQNRVYWHGPPQLSAEKNYQAWLRMNAVAEGTGVCAGMSMREQGKDSHVFEVRHRQVVGASSGELTDAKSKVTKVTLSDYEDVELGIFTGVPQGGWQCLNGRLVVIAQKYSPALLRRHTRISTVTATAAIPNATNNPSAIALADKKNTYLGLKPEETEIKSEVADKHLLFVLDGPDLKLVRESGSGALFSLVAVSKTQKGNLEVFLMEEGGSTPYDYKLVVFGDGTRLRALNAEKTP